MTWLQLVHSCALQYGWTLTDDEAMNLLWEHTGYPGFFQTDPEEECRQQLLKVLAR